MSPQMQRKPILIPLKAGIVIMDRYDLFAESQYTWNDPAIEECAHRILTAHAPYEAKRGEGKVRLNVASKNEEFRKKSVAMLEAYIRGVNRAPNCKLVAAHPAPHYWNEDAGAPCPIGEVGEYGLFIESLKHLTNVAREMGVRFAIENNRNPWHDIPENEEFDHERHSGKIREYFATSPREWAKLPEDVGDPNFGLCLDTSHAVTYAQRFPVAARSGMINLYLALGNDRIWHVHWNDNMIETKAGRDDVHLTVGKGTISREFHRDVWDNSHVRTWLLEHWYGEGELAFEMRYIERL